MPRTLHLQHNVRTQAEPTDRAMQIAVMFGLSLDGTQTHTIIPPTELTLAPGQIVFVTGTSGGGKSTLLRLISEAMSKELPGGRGRACEPPEQAGLYASRAVRSGGSQNPPRPPMRPALICSEDLPTLPDQALVDALAQDKSDAAPSATLQHVCHWLSLAGLNDAAVMLRKPSQLSEGQRHRLMLAQAMAVASRQQESWSVLLIDEFGSTLDRTAAFALARSVRRWVVKSNVCLVAATTHDDLLEPLSPDVLVEVAPGGQCDVHTRTR
jgi:hypothetical protein